MGPGQRGPWRKIPIVTSLAATPMEDAYRRFAQSVRTGELHPMNGRVGLRAIEIALGVFESARLRAPVTFPLTQLRHPLDLLIETENYAAVAT